MARTGDGEGQTDWDAEATVSRGLLSEALGGSGMVSFGRIAPDAAALREAEACEET